MTTRLFITGMFRSGTTLLGTMLNAHERMAIALDPYLPIFYGTVNIWSYLKEGPEKWVSVGINQCGTTEDFLLLGELIGEAVLSLDRKVVLLASGGLSHRFLPFRELRGRESSDPMKNIITPEARRST